MANLKVKPLNWCYRLTHTELLEEYDELPEEFGLIGRDGMYCYQNDVWFEVNGHGYWSADPKRRSREREHFCYTLDINDEAILTQREVDAMTTVVRITRDKLVKDTLNAALRKHYDAVQLRNVGRNAMKTLMSVKRKRKRLTK